MRGQEKEKEGASWTKETRYSSAFCLCLNSLTVYLNSLLRLIDLGSLLTQSAINKADFLKIPSYAKPEKPCYRQSELDECTEFRSAYHLGHKALFTSAFTFIWVLFENEAMGGTSACSWMTAGQLLQRSTSREFHLFKSSHEMCFLGSNMQEVNEAAHTRTHVHVHRTQNALQWKFPSTENRSWLYSSFACRKWQTSGSVGSRFDVLQRILWMPSFSPKLQAF